MRTTPTRWTAIDSPIGRLTLTADDDAITGMWFATLRGESPPVQLASQQDDAAPLLRSAAAQLGEYFAGDRQTFDLPLRPAGTLFQQRVWAALRQIPFGQTITYGELAHRIGNAAASRAVGAANGRNPIGILIPCHRVIGTNGHLTGFGGGIDTKLALLKHEGLLL